MFQGGFCAFQPCVDPFSCFHLVLVLYPKFKREELHQPQASQAQTLSTCIVCYTFIYRDEVQVRIVHA
jgi:hypothetical protein